MQQTEANALKQQWGDKPCRHPEFEKEFILTVPTGKIVCKTCGQVIEKKTHPAATGSDKGKM